MNEGVNKVETNDIVNYAKELYYGQELSWSQVKYALVESGVSELEARDLISKMQEDEEEEMELEKYQELVEEARIEREQEIFVQENMDNPEIADFALEKANNKINYGILWLLGGVILTLVLQGMVIFYGAVIYGVISIFRGINEKSVIKNRRSKN